MFRLELLRKVSVLGIVLFASASAFASKTGSILIEDVSVVDVEPEADPLSLYLTSISRLGELPADTLVLPSHGKPFTGLHQRVAQLHEHHEERLAEVLEACKSAPRCAAELLDLLFKRKLDLHQTTFAMGESVAHLHTLWLAGLVKRRRDQDGIIRFGLERAPARKKGA